MRYITRGKFTRILTTILEGIVKGGQEKKEEIKAGGWH